MFNKVPLIRLDSLDTKKFTDITSVDSASKTCINEKQAKIYIQYWDLYAQALRTNNGPSCNVPKKFDDAIKNVREVASKNIQWHQRPLGIIFIGIIIAALIKLFGFN
ncbi:hypothetical protein [Shewanella mangrovisoli]|uniref:Uncharacterized protein n=1 Tax=Shewanella mangrovisoli TaxID=2864211 RepID=A0ABV4VHV0_9GAMM